MHVVLAMLITVAQHHRHEGMVLSGVGQLITDCSRHGSIHAKTVYALT